MNSESDINRLTTAITCNDKYQKVVHDVCHMPHVTNLEEFHKMYEMEKKAIDKKYDGQPKFPPSLELFAEIYKKFDEYPANLQKLKKQPTRERLNSNISKSSPSLNDSSVNPINKDCSTNILDINKIDIPTASETFSNFVKFQKNLKQLEDVIMHQDVEKEYANKLKQINVFSQQLEKLSTGKVGKSALTSDEENLLEDLVNRMDDLNFIRDHHNVFRQQSVLANNANAKLDSLVEILSHCLLALNSFNIN